MMRIEISDYPLYLSINLILRIVNHIYNLDHQRISIHNYVNDRKIEHHVGPAALKVAVRSIGRQLADWLT